MRKVLVLSMALLVFGCAGAKTALKKVDDGLKQVDEVVSEVAKVADSAVATVDRLEASKDKVATIPQRLESAVTGNEKHSVKKGDTLWGIDKSHGSDGFGWYGIYKANRDQIVHYDLIEPGWALTWNRRQANDLDSRNRAYAEPEKAR